MYFFPFLNFRDPRIRLLGSLAYILLKYFSYSTRLDRYRTRHFGLPNNLGVSVLGGSLSSGFLSILGNEGDPHVERPINIRSIL